MLSAEVLSGTATRALAGRVAVVTGASSGIGRATARELAAAGAALTLFSRSRERLEETAAFIRRGGGIEPLIVAGNVACEADASRLVDRTVERYGGIDILVAAAGIGRAQDSGRLLPFPLVHMPTAEWDEVVETNLTGMFLINRSVLPAMIARGAGDIVNISSHPGGVRGEPMASAYCASKFAVVGLSEALRDEVAQYGIRVQLVLPDATVTPLIGGETRAGRFSVAMPAARIANVILHMVGRPRHCTFGATVIMPWGDDAAP